MESSPIHTSLYQRQTKHYIIPTHKFPSPIPYRTSSIRSIYLSSSPNPNFPIQKISKQKKPPDVGLEPTASRLEVLDIRLASNSGTKIVRNPSFVGCVKARGRGNSLMRYHCASRANSRLNRDFGGYLYIY